VHAPIHHNDTYTRDAVYVRTCTVVMENSKCPKFFDTKENVLNRLRNVNLTQKDQQQHLQLPRASVLVPLFLKSTQHDNKINDSNLEWRVLLTKRRENLRSHSGEVCFPGGKQDLADKNDDILTALRETNEEVGIDTTLVTPICRLETLESYNGLCVTPIVGFVTDVQAMDPATLNVSVDEVEIAFTVPLEYFADETNLTSKYDVEWRGGTFELRTYHYAADCERTFKIWGLTAYIAHQVAIIAFS
jgi:peroxisomal coenzyme A diphosphatase NUDT7